MDKAEARELLEKQINTDSMVQHSLAVSKVMEKLAEKFGEDNKKWELAGLLHDIDYEETRDEPEQHSKKASKILKQYGFDEEVCKAVERHNDEHGLKRESALDKALFCAGPTADLIVAAALIQPDKSLASVDKDFIMNRYEEPYFARDVYRYKIAGSHELGLDIEEFIELALSAMQDNSEDLGL